MRRLYNERRALTIEALDRSLPKGLQVERSPGGMHLVLRLPEDVSDTALAEQVLARVCRYKRCRAGLRHRSVSQVCS